MSEISILAKARYYGTLFHNGQVTKKRLAAKLPEWMQQLENGTTEDARKVYKLIFPGEKAPY